MERKKVVSSFRKESSKINIFTEKVKGKKSTEITQENPTDFSLIFIVKNPTNCVRKKRRNLDSLYSISIGIDLY
jgi:hypothetical protein